jgi:cysteine desulfurase
MTPYFTAVYGNASSIHSFGTEARQAIEDARKTVSSVMNAEPRELIFTGSATEANNAALKGFAFNNGLKKTHIAISSIEHDSILNTAKWLKKQGVKITYLPVDKYGLIKQIELEKTLRNGVSLVSIIHGNNEIGTIQPIKEIGELCHKYGVYFHTDAAQSFGKVTIDVQAMNIDLMTINAHKLYGPKGVGALYIKEGVSIDPLLHGGGHEFGLRSSTENVAAIMGFAKAVELRKEEMKPEAQRLTKSRDRLIKGIQEIDETYLNGHPTLRLSNNVNFRFNYIEGESLVMLLNDEGIAASSGSACSSGSGSPSHVLLAIGLKPEEIHGSLRLSLGKFNTEEDIKYILEILPNTVIRLREMSPLKTLKSFS